MTVSSYKSKALQARHALWDLQKEILNVLKEEYDTENGYGSTPTEWFQVLMTAERYSWLRELTSLVADIDVLTELDFVTETHAGVARAEIERLLFQDTASGTDFNNHYRSILLSGGTLMPLHSRLKSDLQELPAATVEKDQALAERKAWQEEHRHQARKKRN